MKKQEGVPVKPEAKTIVKKKLKAPGKLVPEIRKEESRVKGESKREEGENKGTEGEENKGRDKEENKEKRSGEECQLKDVEEEKLEHTAEVYVGEEGAEEEVEAEGKD